MIELLLLLLLLHEVEIALEAGAQASGYPITASPGKQVQCRALVPGVTDVDYGNERKNKYRRCRQHALSRAFLSASIGTGKEHSVEDWLCRCGCAPAIQIDHDDPSSRDGNAIVQLGAASNRVKSCPFTVGEARRSTFLQNILPCRKTSATTRSLAHTTSQAWGGEGEGEE